MSEHWEQIRDEVLALVKSEAGSVWDEADTDFVKDRATEIGKLTASLLAQPADQRAEVRREIKIEKASILLRISRATLRGGAKLKTILASVFGVLLNFLLSNLPELIAGVV